MFLLKLSSQLLFTKLKNKFSWSLLLICLFKHECYVYNYNYFFYSSLDEAYLIVVYNFLSMFLFWTLFCKFSEGGFAFICKIARMHPSLGLHKGRHSSAHRHLYHSIVYIFLIMVCKGTIIYISHGPAIVRCLCVQTWGLAALKWGASTFWQPY